MKISVVLKDGSSFSFISVFGCSKAEIRKAVLFECLIRGILRSDVVSVSAAFQDVPAWFNAVNGKAVR